MPNISPVRHLYFALPRQHDTTIMVGLLCEASMRKILVTSPKGGCGKTTITRNMAVIAHLNGINTATIDLDPQGSLTHWHRLREQTSKAFLKRQGVIITDEALDEITGIANYATPPRDVDEADLANLKHDLIIIDPPTAVEEYGEAMKRLILAADFVLVPCQPTADDAVSTIPWMEMIGRLGKPAAFILNRVKPRTRSLREAKQQLASVGEICPIEIRDLEDIHRVGAEGLGIGEVKGHPAPQSRNTIGTDGVVR
jgi:chromosome partitioning protein